MRRIAILAAAIATLAARADAGERPASGVAVRLPAGAYLSDPAWVRTPTSAELAALYPEEARKAGKGIVAVLADCVISATGALDDCKIDYEFQPGQGFGPATLQALKLFQASSATRDGRPAAGLRVALRLAWTPPSAGAAEAASQTLVLSIASGSSADATSALPPPAPFFIWNPDWMHLPTADELAPLYPAAARANGRDGAAVIQCKVVRNGGLTDCVSFWETPLGQGFGAATLKAARYFMVHPTLTDGTSLEGGMVLIPLNWRLGQ